MKSLGFFKVIALLFLFCSSNLFPDSISGKIVSDDGMPLPGANVYVENTNEGTITDENGNFSLSYTVGSGVVIFSYMGYKTQRVDLDKIEPSGTITLALDTFQINEVIVTGLTSRREKAVAEVSVARINAESLSEKNEFSDFSNLINGKISGVKVKKTSGNVGGSFRFDVRSGGGLNGWGQPVIYIDGVRMTNVEMSGPNDGGYTGGQGFTHSLSDLNPDDIANIEILKGPAGAVSYGTNGSNGVVLITTKRGSNLDDGKIDIKYKYTMGTNKPSVEFGPEDMLSYDTYNRVHTDGDISEHLFSLSGGNSFAKYFFSLENRYEEGLVIEKAQSFLDRKNIRLNLDVLPYENLNLNISMVFTDKYNSVPINDDHIVGYLANIEGWAEPWGFFSEEAVRMTRSEAASERFIGSVGGTYRPFTNNKMLKNLSIKFSGGIDNYHIETFQIYPYESGVFGMDGWKMIGNGVISQRTGQASLNYHTSFGALKSQSTVGAQFFEFSKSNQFMGKMFFSTGLVTNVGAGSVLFDLNEFKENNREAGVLFEQEFSYDNQLYSTLTLRKDFASQIGKEAASIFYPGIRFAWRLDQNSAASRFIPPFSLFKIRVAQGSTGVLPKSKDSIRQLWQAGSTGYGSTGAIIANVGNAELEPETVKETEFGLDLEFNASFGDIYFEYTKYFLDVTNSIIGVPSSPSTGFNYGINALPTNIGKLKGEGAEYLLRFSPSFLDKSTLDLNLTFSYSNNENEVTDLGGQPEFYDSPGNQVVMKGMPKWAWYTPIITGAKFDEATDVYTGPKYENDGASVFNGLSVPSSMGFFSVDMKLFSLVSVYMNFDGAWGHKIMNWSSGARSAIRSSTANTNNPDYNLYANQVGYSPLFETGLDSDDAITPFEPGTPEYIEAANNLAMLENDTPNYLEKADYIAFRDIGISLDVGRLGLLKNTMMNGLRVTYSITNLKIWSDYWSGDSDKNTNGNGAGERAEAYGRFQGYDSGTQMKPTTHQLTFSINL